jgi:hypothetical protein
MAPDRAECASGHDRRRQMGIRAGKRPGAATPQSEKALFVGPASLHSRGSSHKCGPDIHREADVIMGRWYAKTDDHGPLVCNEADSHARR